MCEVQSWVETFFESLAIYLSCLWSTAWCTLLERKLLAGVQRRKGPNKVSWKGAMQPVADALKLFTKEQVVPARANVMPFKLMPPLALTITMALWHLWPVPNPPHFYQYGVLLFLCLTSCHVYSVVVAGWAANSVYSMLGAMRGVMLVVSYEIPLGILMLSICMQSVSWDMNVMSKWHIFPLVLVNLWVMPCYVVCSVIEMHRAPFDLVEAESELVSGYNTDYGATGFILLFISEYANLIIGSQVISSLWLWPFCWGWSILAGSLIMVCVLLARAVYPRVKCEVLVESCWKSYLPVSLLHMELTFCLTVLF